MNLHWSLLVAFRNNNDSNAFCFYQHCFPWLSLWTLADKVLLKQTLSCPLCLSGHRTEEEWKLFLPGRLRPLPLWPSLTSCDAPEAAGAVHSRRAASTFTTNTTGLRSTNSRYVKTIRKKNSISLRVPGCVQQPAMLWTVEKKVHCILCQSAWTYWAAFTSQRHCGTFSSVF